MQPNGADPNGSPIEYPTVTVDGIKYEVKFTKETLMYRLDKAGVELKFFKQRLEAGSLGIATMYDMLAAAVQVPRAMPMFTGEYLASKIPFAEACDLVNQAMGKVSPSIEMRLSETAANVVDLKPQ